MLDCYMIVLKILVLSIKLRKAGPYQLLKLAKIVSVFGPISKTGKPILMIFRNKLVLNFKSLNAHPMGLWIIFLEPLAIHKLRQKQWSGSKGMFCLLFLAVFSNKMHYLMRKASTPHTHRGY